MSSKQLLHETLKEKWSEYAKAKAKYEILNESKHSVLATEASKHEWSEALKERMARKSDEYRAYLVWLWQAREEELKLKFEIDSINMHFDYYRTQEATKRKELNTL